MAVLLRYTILSPDHMSPAVLAQSLQHHTHTQQTQEVTQRITTAACVYVDDCLSHDDWFYSTQTLTLGATVADRGHFL